MSMSHTIQEISAANLDRSNHWHPGGLDEWSVSDWGVALAGEVGEACNKIKKLRRLETGSRGRADYLGREELVTEIGKELADAYLYLDLLAAKLGLNLETEVVKKFNEVSIREDLPHRL